MSSTPSARELRADFLCRRCGYNLRGLTDAGDCPECGTPIEWSIRGWTLGHANPQWLRRLKAGASALLAMTAFLLILLVLVLAALFPPHSDLGVPVITILFAALAAQLAALWLLTTPEPFVEGAAVIDARRFTRFAGGGAMLFALGALAYKSTQLATLGFFPIDDVPLVVFLLPPPFALFLLLGHVRSIAARAPQSLLETGVRTFRFGMGLTAGISFVLTGLIVAADGPMALGFAALCAAPVVYLVFNIWLMVLAGDLGGVLRDAIEGSVIRSHGRGG